MSLLACVMMAIVGQSLASSIAEVNKFKRDIEGAGHICTKQSYTTKNIRAIPKLYQ